MVQISGRLLLGGLLSGCLCGACGGSPTTPSSQTTQTPAPTPTPTPVPTRLVLRDDFNGSVLDGNNWLMPAGVGTFFGRTQLRPPSQPLQVVNGVLRLRLDTYNPTALTPGDSFWGSEIVTRQTFTVGNGIAFLARVRVAGPVPGGIVAALFAYAARGGLRDEIDFEMLTNDPNRVLTNVFKAEGFNVPGRPQFVSGVSPTEFNEFEVDWFPDRIQWKVNGQVVREELNGLPDQPMTVRLNFWAPAADFPEAFSASLRPASSAPDNQIFFYEVDYVEIRAF